MNTYTTLRLSKELHNRLKALALKNKRPMTAQLEVLIYNEEDDRAVGAVIKSFPAKDYSALLKKK